MIRFEDLPQLHSSKNQECFGTTFSAQFDQHVCIVAIGNPERHMRKASHCGSKQQ